MQFARTFLVVLLTVTIAWALQRRGPHSFEKKCFECHVGLKNPNILTRDADFLCLSCHQEQKEMTHPTGMIPAKNIPVGFPLYKGKMLCITCHIAHQTYDEKNIQHKRFDNNPYLLRFGENGKVFCYQCHYGDFGDYSVSKIDSHAVAFKSAHALSHNISLKEVLDDDSRECLSCHDGTLSSDVTVKASGVNWEHSKGIGVSHPIGIDYDRVYRSKQREYHVSSSLDPRIKLFNGKLGCQTCHNHFSDIPNLLVMENKRSRMCLQCHNL